MTEQARYTEHVYTEHIRGYFVDPLYQREEIVRCWDCNCWEMLGNQCQGWCCEWSTVTGSREYCSRGERRDGAE